MALEDSKKGKGAKGRKLQSAPKKVAVATPHVTSTKTVQNMSLQSWPIPTGNGTVLLPPGASVQIPASAVTKRLINLYKRRLISIR